MYLGQSANQIFLKVDLTSALMHCLTAAASIDKHTAVKSNSNCFFVEKTVIVFNKIQNVRLRISLSPLVGVKLDGFPYDGGTLVSFFDSSLSMDDTNNGSIMVINEFIEALENITK